MAKIDLTRVLKKKRLSKRQFAKLLGVRYENVFRLFRVGYNPRFSSLVVIARRLEVRVRDLISDDDLK